MVAQGFCGPDMMKARPRNARVCPEGDGRVRLERIMSVGARKTLERAIGPSILDKVEG